MSVTGVDEAQASGVTGKGITVAVLDGPINPDLPELVGTDLVVAGPSTCDVDGDGEPEPAVASGLNAVHASNMTALIVGTGASATGQPGVRGVAPDATVRHYATYWDAKNAGCKLDGVDGAALALERAIDDGADIVSMSFSGTDWGPAGDEAVARAVREGVILVGASSHDGTDDIDFPASYNGAVGVESATATAELSQRTSWGPRLGVVAPGEGFLVNGFDEASGTWNHYRLESGSSTATAFTAGVLALAWSAHPDATGNQMIQALLRTTTQNGGELRRIDDAWGYGLVNVVNLMSVDPTQYPDENPMIRAGADEFPDISLITGGATAEPTVAPTDGPTVAPDGPVAQGGDDDAAAGVPPALLIGGGAVLVVLVVVGLLVGRARRTTARPSPEVTVVRGV